VPFDIDGPAMMQHRVSRTAALDVWGTGAIRTGRRAKKNSKIRLGTSLIIDLAEYWGPSLFVIVIAMSRADPSSQV